MSDLSLIRKITTTKKVPRRAPAQPGDCAEGGGEEKSAGVSTTPKVQIPLRKEKKKEKEKKRKVLQRGAD